MALADGPLQVAVAGGSIGGPCAGLALQRIAGAEVEVVLQIPDRGIEPLSEAMR